MNELNGNPGDEFEFKPLTKGLGFHPKKETTTTPPKSFVTSHAAAQTQTPKNLQLNTQISSPSSSRPLRLDTPLPRPEPRKTPSPSQSTQAVEKILKNLNEKNKGLNFQDKGQPLSPFVQTAPSLAAGFLDLLLITALGLLYLMTLIFTLKLDLIKALSEGGSSVWLSTSTVFAGVGLVYYMAQRMFMGFTMGEWAYEQRLGLPEEMKQPSYGPKVLGRQLLIMVTGVVTIPLLSWALGRDLGGISGLCIYRKR